MTEVIDEYIANKNHFVAKKQQLISFLDEDFIDENMAHIRRNYALINTRCAEYNLSLTKTPAIWVA